MFSQVGTSVRGVFRISGLLNIRFRAGFCVLCCLEVF